jgi:4-amino-4-deoxy-L-arabinose transferase-like glycosyltransferase
VSTVRDFLKAHAVLIALLLYGSFLTLCKLSGSFAGDEATYSQIARECLSNHHFFVLSLNDRVWFEKPPFLIWLTILSFKIFGITEFSARFFPSIFGVLSAGTLYFFGKELFERKISGFVAGFVFLTTPIVLFYTRNNMMDIPVGFFICFAAFALWKIFQGESWWWIMFGIASGLAVMTKSVVGLLPFFLFILLVILWKRLDIVKNYFFFWGMSLFFFISAPWHIYMSLQFGMLFWKEYLGFQVFQRVTQPLFAVPWQGDSNTAYWELFSQRSGLWVYFFLLFLFVSCGMFLLQYLVSTKSFSQSVFLAWFQVKKKSFIFLFCFAFVALFPFLLAETKLPNYMILAYYPLSLAIGGFLGYFVQEKKRLALLALAGFSLLNFLPIFSSRALVFGEAQFLYAKIGKHFFQGNGVLLVAVAMTILLMLASILYRQRQKTFFVSSMLSMIVIGNMMVPLHPERNADVKKIGGYLTKISSDHPVVLYYLVPPEFYSFQPVMTFYLPLGSTVENNFGRGVEMVSKDSVDFSSWCYRDRVFISNDEIKQALFSSGRGIVDTCMVLH